MSETHGFDGWSPPSDTILRPKMAECLSRNRAGEIELSELVIAENSPFDGKTVCVAGRGKQYEASAAEVKQWCKDENAKIASDVTASTHTLIRGLLQDHPFVRPDSTS